MPRIPLYNQGQGPAVQLATGPLSRRADVGAFTAPGQALASFGEQASDIAFRFGIEERKRKDQTILQEVESEANDFATMMRKQDENVVDETSVSASNFEQYKQDYMQRLQQKGLSQRRLRLAEGVVNSVFAQNSLIAKQNAWNLGTKKSTDADNISLGRHLETFAITLPGQPNYDRAYSQAKSIIERANSEGRKLAINSVEELELQIKSKQFDASMLTVNTVADARAAYQSVADDETIPLATKTAASKILQQAITRIQNETYEATIESLVEANLTAKDYNEINAMAKSGEAGVYTTESGRQISLPFSDISIGDRTKVMKFATDGAASFNADRQSFISSDIINGFDVGGSAGAVKMAAANFVSEEDKGNAEIGILSAADYMITQAKLQTAEGNFSEAEKFVSTAKSLLTTGYGGRDSFDRQSGSVGDKARNYLDALPSITKTINETRIAQGRISQVARDISSFTLVKSNWKNDEIKAGLEIALGQTETLQQGLQILQRNGLTSKRLTDRLNGQYNIANGLDPDFEDPSMLEGYAIYKNLNVFGGAMVERHTSPEAREFYNAAMVFEITGGKTPAAALKLAMDASKKQYKPEDTARFKQDFNRVFDKTTNEAEGGFLGWFGKPVRNQAAVRRSMEDLAVNYIKLGVDTKNALLIAKDEILSTSMMLNGVLVPKSKTYEGINIERLVEYAAIDFLSKNPDEELNLEDISLVPVSGRTDEFSVYLDGQGFIPATDMNNTVYTITELMELGINYNFDHWNSIAESHRSDRIVTEPELKDYNFLSPDDMLIEGYEQPFNFSLGLSEDFIGEDIPSSTVFGVTP